MVRVALILFVLTIAAVVVSWQFDLLENPFARPPAPPPVPALLSALASGDEETVLAALAVEGVDLQVLDDAGRPPLQLAAINGFVAASEALIARGADLHGATADGATPLLLALQHARDARLPTLLLNAGADPTVVNAAGEGAAEAIARNPALRGTVLALRIQELVERPFIAGWPSLYVSPVPGATLSSRAAHWPNANRAYRNGRHEGFDFYDGAVSGGTTITYGTPIVAVAAGVAIRVDHDYVEMDRATYDRIIAEARASLSTPEAILDMLRGRQVWIEHPGGFVTRYAHLADIPANLQVGDAVNQGQEVGTTGNSGTIDGVLGTREDPHPHVEIWSGATFLGQGLEPEAIFALAGQLFGQRAMPPRWGP
jgi:murein DD-endopeptidase MepM/ murein hydrolase activator NlpD